MVLIWTTESSAQYGDFQRMLFRGAEYAGNNLFLSNPQGGPLYDYNQFRQRLEYNRAGDGYTYESFRFFGSDSFGNTNTLDLGPFKIELGFDPAVTPSNQAIGIHNRIGYTTRFIPEVFFESQTGQRTYNQFSGVSTYAPTPLNYTVTFNTGIQDFEWSGNALLDMSGRINVLGFYDFEMQFTNIGSYEADGLFVHDEQVNDFDIGPINISGNIGFDLLAGLLQGDGATGDAVPPRIYSGAAQKDKTADDLLAQMKAGEALTEGEMRFLAQEMFRAAFEADPLGMLTNGMPSDVPGFEGLMLSTTAAPGTGDGDGSDGALSTVPEPGTLGFLAGAVAALAAARPFRRRRT